MRPRIINGAFGEYIEKIITEKHLSYEEAAKLIGIDRTVLRRHMQGVARPYNATLELYSKAFDIPVETLIELRRATDIYKNLSDQEKFAEDMQKIVYTNLYDSEVRHILMDALLCVKLKELGFEQGVEIFEKTAKYY